MKRFIASTLALTALCLVTALPANATSCSDQLQQKMIVARTAEPAVRTSDLEMYLSFYQCLGLSMAEASGFAALRIQLAQAGEDYVAGRFKPAAFQSYLLDRQRKAELMRESPAYSIDVGHSDTDGDLVPDSSDNCPQTEAFVATDDMGCDLFCPPAVPELSSSYPFCLIAQLPNSAEDPLQPLIDASIPVNLSCEDVTPAASTPIAWGRRETSVSLSGRPPPFEDVNVRRGYYFSVRRTSQQAAGCETWYALQFTFRSPKSAWAPTIDIVSVLFSSAEDEDKSNPAIVRFPLFTFQRHIRGGSFSYVLPLPLSDGRYRLREALLNYSDVSIRVRVITGAQQSSPWSAYIAKTAGVAISD